MLGWIGGVEWMVRSDQSLILGIGLHVWAISIGLNRRFRSDLAGCSREGGTLLYSREINSNEYPIV